MITGEEKGFDAWRGQRTPFAELLLDERLLNVDAQPRSLTLHRVNDRDRALVFENEEPYLDALARALEDPDGVAYGVLVFGNGLQFKSSWAWLPRLQPSVREVYYVGDLDRPGMEIASHAGDALANHDVQLRPAAHVLRKMRQVASDLGHPHGWPADPSHSQTPLPTTYVSHLPDELGVPITEILTSGYRVPEEVVPYFMGDALRVLEAV